MTTQLDRQSKLTLYALKREYGGSIDIYKLGSSTTNVKTGTKAIVVVVHCIRRAIILPTTQTRAASPAFAGSRKGANPGGLLDTNIRQFIVDRSDAPTLLALTPDDWIIYQGRKYQIAEVESFEFDSGWLITAKELVGEVPQQIIHANVDHLMDLQTEAESE